LNPAALETDGTTAAVPSQWSSSHEASRWAAPSSANSLRVAALIGLTLTVIGVAGSAIGEVLPARVLVLLAAGALFAQARQEWRVGIAGSVGLIALAMMNPVFSLYFLVLVVALTAVRRSTFPFLAVLVLAAMVAPKTAFTVRYHEPGYWNWINEPSLTLAIFVSAMWLRTRSQTRPGSPPPHDDPLSFALYYLFPSHAANPMVFSPVLLSRERRIDARSVLILLGWFVVKAVALVTLRQLGPRAFLVGVAPGDVLTVGRFELWGMVIASYLETFLALAATADIPVLIGRLFGFPLPDPFRFPLLAWNPVELWRRWGIYNRNVLLQLVYFPLGGSRRRKYLNVMLTFLGSALLLHSGWFGSKYWQVGAPGWRDQSVYFLLQGLGVCACLAVWDWTGKPPRNRTVPRVSLALVAAIAATQTWTALIHVMVLAPNVTIADRARLVARCLGLA
jgi:hypothetical protein